MKLFKKINKGLILTALVVIIILMYLFRLDTYRKSEKTAIDNACDEYINEVNKYLIFPEEYISQKEEITTEQLDKYMSDIKSNISKYIVSNEGVLNVELNSIKANLQNQIKGKEIITSYKREIIDKKDYNWDNDQVSIKLNTYYEYKIGGNTNSNNIQNSITLKKEDGNWKIVHSDLVNYQIMKYFDSMEVM